MSSAVLISDYEYDQYDYLLKIIIVGDSGCGKSSLLKRFSSSEFPSHHLPTIGVDFDIRSMQYKGKIAKMQLWDTAGQERFHTITQSYYRGADAILIVYDVTDQQTFNNAKKWYQEIRQYAKDDVQLLLVGNKSDLVDLRVVSHADGESLAAELQSPYIETSAKNAINVDIAFQNVATRFIDHASPSLQNQSSKLKSHVYNRGTGLRVDNQASSDDDDAARTCPKCLIM